MTEHEIAAAAAETGIPADVLAGYIEAGCTVDEAVECESTPPLDRAATIARAAVQRRGPRGRGWMGNGSGMIESRRLPNPVNGFTYVAEIVLLRRFDGGETDNVLYACQWLGSTPTEAYERSVRAAHEVADYAGYTFHHVRADAHICPKCTAAMDGPARACDACLERIVAPYPPAPQDPLPPAGYTPQEGHVYTGYAPYILPGGKRVMVHRWMRGNVQIDMTNEEIARVLGNAPDSTWPVRVPVSFTDSARGVMSTILEVAPDADPVAAGLEWARARAHGTLHSVRVNGEEVPVSAS